MCVFCECEESEFCLLKSERECVCHVGRQVWLVSFVSIVMVSLCYSNRVIEAFDSIVDFSVQIYLSTHFFYEYN